MKLVGRYRFVVTGVEVGVNANNNHVLKMSMDFTDEFVNGQWVAMFNAVPQTKTFSLKTGTPGKSGKTAAMVTAQQLKGAFGYTGGLAKLGDLVLARGECVCEDHNDGNFTRITDIFAPGSSEHPAKGLKEFTPDVLDEINKAFGAAA